MFMGSRGLGLAALRAIVESGHEVVLVVTPDDGDAHSNGTPIPSVAECADRYGIPRVRGAEDERGELSRLVARSRPDIVVSANWRRLIGRSILDRARHGGINIHRSLLPAYGGLDPINWAIVKGETETGVTIHVLADRFDIGDIVLQRRIRIGPAETGFAVHKKSLRTVGEMITEVLQQFADGTVTRTAQDPATLKIFQRRTDNDNRINWRADSIEIHNLIRAQSDPFPNAHASVGGKRLNIKSASPATGSFEGRAGSIAYRTSRGVVVLCGPDESARSGLIVHVVQEGSGRPTDARGYFADRTAGFDED
jgi:methionyl-tRNA formyltransferase